MGVGSGGRGPCPPSIFIHGTNIVDRGLIVSGVTDGGTNAPLAAQM